MIQLLSFISNLSQTDCDGQLDGKDALRTYICLLINLCFGPSYHLKKVGQEVFPHPM
jgi:hypothetical protein